MKRTITKSNSTLIHEWDNLDTKERYRLLAVGKWSPGYQDKYIIEMLGQDGLGEPRWDEVVQWDPSDSIALDLLISCLKSVLKP